MGWEQMTGNDRVRFCDYCHLNVYNISELSRVEAEQLIASNEGRLCARLFRRADGSVLTKDCPVGLRALRRRVAKRTAALFAALVSLSAAVFGQDGSKTGKTECTPRTRITRLDASSDPNEKMLSGSVAGPIGVAIPGATIRLLDADAKEVRQTSTNDGGKFEFSPIEAGHYSITIESFGFKTLEIKDIIVEKDKLTNIDMILEFSGATATIGLLAGEPTLIESRPGTTIFTDKMIQRLPIP
jgi:hypothetical protein